MKTRRIFAVLLTLGIATSVPAVARDESGLPVKQGFADRDGPFSAMMLFIPHSELPEFDKPSDQGPHITNLRTAKVGDVVAVKIVFDNPQANSDGIIDVTYDVKVTAPNGEVYSGADHQGLEAIRVHVGSDTIGVFDNRAQTLALRLEAKDLPGTYKATAVLHDNIAGRHVPLRAEIELKK